MNKLSSYAFCFIVILIGLNLIGSCNYNRKIKDNSVIEEDSCVYGINDTIDTLIIEEVDSDNLVQGTLSPMLSMFAPTETPRICLLPLLMLASNIVNDKL